MAHRAYGPDFGYGIKAYMTSPTGLALKADETELFVFALIADRTEGDPEMSALVAPVESIAKQVGSTPGRTADAIVRLIEQDLVINKGTVLAADGGMQSALAVNPRAVEDARRSMHSASGWEVVK